MMLLTAHNLAYYQELMAGLRKAIAEGRLEDHVAEVKAGWARGAQDGASEAVGHMDNAAASPEEPDLV